MDRFGQSLRFCYLEFDKEAFLIVTVSNGVFFDLKCYLRAELLWSLWTLFLFLHQDEIPTAEETSVVAVGPIHERQLQRGKKSQLNIWILGRICRCGFLRIFTYTDIVFFI